MNMTPEDWMIEIQNAKEYRRLFGYEDSWSHLEDMYNNSPNSDTALGSNLIYSMGDSLLSGLAVPNPEFVITAEHPKCVGKVGTLEYVDNWLSKKLKLKRHIEQSLLFGYLRSRCIVKVGYDSEFGWSPSYDVGANEQKLYGLTTTQFDQTGNRIEFKDSVPGMPWIAAVDPIDFVVPWGTVWLEDAPWCAHRIIRLNKDIKKDRKYKNTSRLEGSTSMENFMESYRRSAHIKRSQRAESTGQYNQNTKDLYNELWEIHDRRTGRVIVVAPDYDKFLRNEMDALQVNGHPFVTNSFVPSARSFWSTPQAYYLGQIQHEEFDISMQMSKQRRINVLRFLMQKGKISHDEAQKLISGDVGAVAEVEGGGDLRQTFVAAPQGSNFDLSLQSDANRANARDAVGFSRNQLGEYDSSSRRTAQEAKLVAGGAGRRESRRVQCVQELYTDTIEKVNSLVFRFWKTPRYALVENEWLQFTGDEIEGQYLYDVGLTSKRYISSAERKVEAIVLMSQLAQMPGVNIEQLYQYVMDAANDPSFERIFMQQGGGQPNAQMQLQGAG